MKYLSVAATWVAVSVLSACGGDDDGVGEGGPSGLTCAPDEFALQGNVDGQPVSYRGQLRGHAWIQSSPGSTFDAQFEGGGAVHAEWQGLIADGATTNITGQVTLPPGDALGGQTLSAEAGSLSKREDTVRFELRTLSQVVQCVTEPCPAQGVEGSLTGCVQWEPFMF